MVLPELALEDASPDELLLEELSPEELAVTVLLSDELSPVEVLFEELLLEELVLEELSLPDTLSAAFLMAFSLVSKPFLTLSRRPASAEVEPNTKSIPHNTAQNNTILLLT